MINAVENGAVQLRYDDTMRVATTPSGADITGTLNVTGISTFGGALSGTTGTFSGDITANGNIAGDNSTNITGIAGVTATTLTGTLQTAAQANVTSVGTLTALTVSGDVSIADKIIHTGDTNTAIRFPTADTITAETDGSERLRISSDGKVGINITDNTTDLHVRNAASPGDASFKMGGSNSTASGLRISYSNSGNTSTIIKQNYRATSADALMEFDSGIHVFKSGTGGTERLRITSAGDVGIGVADPDAKLEVLEDIYVKGSSGDGSVGIQIRSGSSALSNQHQIRTGGGSGDQLFIEALGGSSAIVTKVAGSERMRIISSGEVSIGGFTPTAGDGILQLNGGLRIAGSASASDTTSPYIYRTSGVDNLNFATNGVERVKITSAGLTRLMLASNSSLVEPLRLENTGSGAGTNVGMVFYNGNGSTGAGALARIKALDVDNYDSDLAFETGLKSSHSDTTTERLRITSAGHVLIGVTSVEDTTGNSGPKIIHTGDIQIDGDQKVLLFRSTSSSAQKQSGIQWWNENGAGVQCAIFAIRDTVTYAKSSLGFYTTDNVDTSSNNSEGNIEEIMRITNEKAVRVGQSLTTAAAGRFQVVEERGGQQANDCNVYFETNANDWNLKSYYNSSGAHYHIEFIEQGATRGSITGNDGSNVNYNQGSDYRWKENIVEMTGTEGIDICKKLKPSKYNWIENREETGQINTVDGFIAHEVEEAGVLGAVTGEKDVVNEDGSIKGQMLDYGQMTPVLAAAIKGLIEKVETLETKVAALEGS